MFCPNCGAEYRESFTLCSDCQIGLVAEPPSKRAKNAPAQKEDELGDEHDSFTLVWSGIDPRAHADAREALASENIPARTIREQDHLIYATVSSPFEVYVPAEFAARAKQTLKDANASEDALDRLAASGALEIPAEDDDDTDEDAPSSKATAFGDAMEDPSAATSAVWTGGDSDIARMIEASLRENYIYPVTITGAAAATTIFVVPEDEPRAQKIIREITDATPPN